MYSRQEYKVIGMMSGTSLDGVDIACCRFSRKKRWTFSIDYAETQAYSARWKNKLSKAHTLSSEDLLALDIEYGEQLGVWCKNFMTRNKIKHVDFIASHGHTVFHQPQKKITLQIGNGNAIHAATGLPVVYDFRSLDVLRGGQGAPLVPIGDHLLFPEYDVCLNLGGIANFSTATTGKRKAFDICFVNMGLNFLAAEKGKKFDRNGEMSCMGEIHSKLLKQLSTIYSRVRKSRNSLSREFFEKEIQPLLEQKKTLLEDRLRTFTESAAIEIAKTIMTSSKKLSMLCTGGGAFNTFLIYRLLENCGDNVELNVPDEHIVKFKEAVIFAFLGVLRVRGEVNCLKGVTRARQDSSGGIMAGF